MFTSHQDFYKSLVASETASSQNCYKGSKELKVTDRQLRVLERQSAQHHAQTQTWNKQHEISSAALYSTNTRSVKQVHTAKQVWYSRV